MSNATTNPLVSLHAQLREIATRYATNDARVSIYFGQKAELGITGKLDAVKAVLARMIEDADALRAELPGRKLGIARRRGHRYWVIRYDDGQATGKHRAAVTVEMTDAEYTAVLMGRAVGLGRG